MLYYNYCVHHCTSLRNATKIDKRKIAALGAAQKGFVYIAFSYAAPTENIHCLAAVGIKKNPFQQSHTLKIEK